MRARTPFDLNFEIRTVVTRAFMDGYAASISDVRRADAVMEALDHAGFSIVPKIAEGRIDAIYEAASTGSWAGISEREWKAWTAAIHAGYVSKNTAVAPAKPGKETGRVVVLDEAGERKLQDLISGKSVPTGRIVEVTYRNPDGSAHTQRHAEFGSLDKVSYDPPPVVGSEIAGATVLKATETVRNLAAGDYSDMCDRTFRNLVRQMGFIHGAIVHADGSITPLDKEAMDAGVVAVGERPLYEWTQRPKETVDLEPGILREVPAGMKLEPGLVAEVPAGMKLGSSPPLEGNAKAVRDLVTAHGLIARAEAVLGNDAVDEILNNLADPADQSEAV